MIRRVLILLSYAVTMAAVLVATVMLVELGQGYSYDFKTRQFYINGLLSLTSSPSSATLYINGKPTRHSTPYRSTLKTGTYNLELRKPGFHTWSKQVDITPFQVLSLDAVFLVPNSIPETNLTTNQTASGLVASHDRRHFAYIASDSLPGVWVINGDHGPGLKIYTPTPASEDHSAETVKEVTWSSDNSHLLIHGDIGGASVYTLVSSSGGTPTNLSDIFKLDLTGLEFSPYDWRELYWNSADGLRRLNAGDKTTSAVLAEKVSGFNFAGDKIVYVHTTALGKSVWSMDRSGNNQKQLIESLAESSSYQVDYMNYRGLDALGVLPAGSSVATLYLDIFSANPVSKVVSKDASKISFSDNGRYLGFYNSNGFGTYDLEKNVILLSSKTSPLNCFNWFDNAHVVLCRQNEVDVAELDGANLTKVADIAPGASAYGYGDLKHIYSIGPVQGASSVVFSAQIKQ